MSITTGYVRGPEPQAGVTGMSVELFSGVAMTSETTSAVVHIPPGMAGVFTIFNMPENRHVYTELVLVNTMTRVVSVDNCASPARDRNIAVDSYSLRPTIGGGPDAWVFDSDRPQKIIALPGSYRFVLEDKDMLDDTDMIMRYAQIQLENLPELGVLVLS